MVSRVTSSYLPVSNFFKALAEKTEEADKVALYGDSHARSTAEDFCMRRNKKRRRTSIPGGNIEDIAAAIKAEVKEDENHVIIMASGNDVGDRRTSELKREYETLLNYLIDKRKGVICAGVFPRLVWTRYEREQAMRMNDMLSGLCKGLKVSYLDLWSNFNGQNNLFARDGIHLNSVGNARLGRVLDQGLVSHANSRANFQLEKQAEVTV